MSIVVFCFMKILPKYFVLIRKFCVPLEMGHFKNMIFKKHYFYLEGITEKFQIYPS